MPASSSSFPEVTIENITHSLLPVKWRGLSANTEDFLFSTDSFATTIDAVTGYKDGPAFWGTERAPTLYFTESGPVPMTIRSVNTKVEVEF